MNINNFEEGDEIEIEYTVYQTVGTDRDEQRTTVATTVVNTDNELKWKAGSTGTGKVTNNGLVYDGNGLKIGIDATISKNN